MPHFLFIPSGAPTLPTSGLEFNIDLTSLDTWDGTTDTQQFKNTVSSPASGVAQSAYHFYRGADGSVAADDPSVVGTAGTSGIYANLDGGDYCKIVSGNTDFIKKAVRTDETHQTSFILGFRTPSSLASPFALFSNSQSTPLDHGFLVYTTGGGIQLWRRNATGSTNIIQLVPASTLATNTDYMLMFDYNSSTFTWNCYLNSTTVSYSGTGSSMASESDATKSFVLFTQPDSFNALPPSGTRFYFIGAYNTTLSGKASQIKAYYDYRKGTTF